MAAATAAAVPPHGEGAGASSASRNRRARPAQARPASGSVRPSRHDASAQVIDNRGPRLDPGGAECALEILDECLPERGVLLRACDERIELERARRAAPAPPRSIRPEPEGGGAAARRGALRRTPSSDHLSTGRGSEGVSSVTAPPLPARSGDGRGSARSCSRSSRAESRAPRRSCGSSRPAQRSGRGSHGTRARAVREALPDDERLVERLRSRRRRAARRSRRPGRCGRRRGARRGSSSRVSWPIHGRIASSERSEPSRS